MCRSREFSRRPLGSLPREARHGMGNHQLLDGSRYFPGVIESLRGLICHGSFFCNKYDQLLLRCLQDVSVPHIWFWHFYLVGVVCNGATLCLAAVPLVARAVSPRLYAAMARPNSTDGSLEAMTYMTVASLLVMCMLQTHLVRRLVETLFMMRCSVFPTPYCALFSFPSPLLSKQLHKHLHNAQKHLHKHLCRARQAPTQEPRHTCSNVPTKAYATGTVNLMLLFSASIPFILPLTSCSTQSCILYISHFPRDLASKVLCTSPTTQTVRIT